MDENIAHTRLHDRPRWRIVRRIAQKRPSAVVGRATQHLRPRYRHRAETSLRRLDGRYGGRKSHSNAKAEWPRRVEPGGSIAVTRTAGIGALQPVADDAAYGRRCPPLRSLPIASRGVSVGTTSRPARHARQSRHRRDSNRAPSRRLAGDALSIRSRRANREYPERCRLQLNQADRLGVYVAAGSDGPPGLQL